MHFKREKQDDPKKYLINEGIKFAASGAFVGASVAGIGGVAAGMHGVGVGEITAYVGSAYFECQKNFW